MEINMYIEGLEVIYFAYKPGRKFFVSLERMARQILLPDAVTIYMTVEDDDPVLKRGAAALTSLYGAEFEDKVRKACTGIRKVNIEYVERSEFRHGGTRQKAMDSSGYERVLLMTQDAVPLNRKLTLELDRALDNSDAATAYARQTAYPNADTVERLYRQFNYPETSMSKNASDIDKIGIKAFFCSDVCCMYKHDLFDRLGGFDVTLNFNEDSIFAYYALKSGYTVEYAARAEVYHSHNESFKAKYLRSRQLARSQKDHPEVFSNVSSAHEGMRFFTGTLKTLIKSGDIKGIFSLISNCAAKYLGYIAGKHVK